MSQASDQVCWTEDQWNLVRKTVADEAQKARVAAQFLPLFGPVDPTSVAVPNLHLRTTGGPPPRRRLSVDSTPATFLANIEVQVALATRELADPELSAALTMFRRAAGYVARVEDALIFNGQPGAGLPPRQGVAGIPPVWRVTGGARQDGLLPWIARGILLTPPPIARPRIGARIGGGRRGTNIINAVIRAITRLESRGHSGPFTCVLAPDLFGLVCNPSGNLVLPRDRILPFLDGGALLRTSAVPHGFGVVVAMAGDPVELVVARDISVRYLQTTLQPRAVFRISERVVLRIKEMGAIAVLH